MLKIFRKLFLLSGILFIYLWAGTTGKISGRVTDATTGEGLPFAVVRILGTQMGAYTDDQGYYVILNVHPGTYDLEVTYTGYQPLVIKNVVVEVGRTIEVNFVLKPTEIEVPPIVVEAEVKLIKPDVTESKHTMRAEDIQNIPVTTIQQTVALSAGVIEREGELHVRGGRPDEVVFVVNGVEIRDPYTNFTNAGAPLIALEEASVLRGGFDVDQGITSSGAISVVTRSGTDKYALEYRASTNNMRFLSPSVYGFFNSEKGDYYQDVLLGVNPDINVVDETRYSDDEVFHEVAISGPIFPNRRDWAKFFVAGEYITDRTRFPMSLDRNYRRLNQALTYRINIPFTSNILFFISGFYRYQRWKNWDPAWRLALDNFYRFEQRQFQVAGGLNWLVAGKYMNEFRLGYYHRQWKRNVLEDVDGDGVDDFDDRDKDGFVEIDLDYFRHVYFDTLNNEWVVSGYDFGIDSMVSKYSIPRSAFEVNEEEGYIEVPFFWWEEAVAGMYPSSSRGPEWWPADETYTAPYNTFGWGERTRQDIKVLEILTYEEGFPSIDTVVLIGDVFYKYPFEPTFDYLLNGKISVPEDFKVTKILAEVGNHYLPYPWVYPRDQWGVGESKLLTFSWRLTGQVVKKTETRAGHEILAGLEYKRHDIMRYTVDFAGGLSNIYFDFVNPPFETREWDKGYSFVNWFKDHPVKPWQFAFYLRDKIEMEGMVAKIGFRFDYYDPAGYYFGDSLNPFAVDSVYKLQRIKYLNNPEKAKPQWYISPRIGVSHPITERDVLHFTYGHYYQIPPFYQIITSYAFSGAFPIIGNPTIDPMKTISYELGVKHGFTDNIVVDITVFYKDIYQWARSKMFSLGPEGNYTTFLNEDYGFSRGVELTFIKRPAGDILPNLGLNISYTYQVAKGSFSSPFSGYIYQWYRYPLPPRESPLNWDIRHNFVGIFSWIVPEGDKKFIVDDWGVSLSYYYSSGAPWTPTFRDPRDAMEKINAERMPSVKRADLRLFKNIKLNRFTKLQLFMDIYNLFNDLNLTDIATVDWYEQFGDPEGEEKSLNVWEPRRTTRIGFFINITGF